MNAVLTAGYPYELAGIIYYAFFLLMSRKRFAANYSNRSRYLVLLAAIVMVGCVPFHYGNIFAGVVAMLAAAIIALLSTFADAIADHRRKR